MLNVLVVDDDQAQRLSVRSALESSKKFKVDEAFDGINALDKIKSAAPQSGRPYDIVILDVDMPRLNGLETLKQIKEIDPGVIVDEILIDLGGAKKAYSSVPETRIKFAALTK